MKKYKALLASSMVIATFVAANAVSARVEGFDAEVYKGAKMTITKTVDLADDETLMPKTSFDFVVAPVKEGTGGQKDGLTVYPGKPLANSNFKVDYDNSVKSARRNKTVDVDFAGVEFDRPGIYLYSVTENQGNTKGVIYDDTTYIVSVYVLDNGAGKYVASYVVPTEKDSTAKKPIQFNNKLKTTSLTVEKKVTGNAGDRNLDFNFTLELLENAEFKKGQQVTLIKYDRQKASTRLTATIGQEITFELKDGESIRLDKLPVGIRYKVIETDPKGYTASAQLTEVGESAVKYNLGDEKESDNTADTIVVTNTKDGVIPTGVVNTIAPFAALAIVAIGGSLYFVKRKKA